MEPSNSIRLRLLLVTRSLRELSEAVLLNRLPLLSRQSFIDSSLDFSVLCRCLLQRATCLETPTIRWTALLIACWTSSKAGCMVMFGMARITLARKNGRFSFLLASLYFCASATKENKEDRKKKMNERKRTGKMKKGKERRT